MFPIRQEHFILLRLRIESGMESQLVIRPYGKLFKVVGEAYVHGLMEGEAMKFLETDGYQVQDFTFC